MKVQARRLRARQLHKAKPDRAGLAPIPKPPEVPFCTVSTTPETWAEGHRIVTGHAATISPWGAICACGALWSRDPKKGGEARQAPDAGTS